MAKGKNRFFILLLTVLFVVGITAGCAYDPEQGMIIDSAPPTQGDDASVLQAYKAAPEDSMHLWEEDTYGQFYYLDGKAMVPDNTLADRDCFSVSKDTHNTIAIIKDLVPEGWEALVASQGKQVRVYFYLLGHSEVYLKRPVGLYCGFKVLDDAESAPDYDALIQAMEKYNAAFVPEEPEPLTLPSSVQNSLYPVYKDGPYMVGKDIPEGLYLLLSLEDDSSYSYSYAPVGYDALLYEPFSKDDAILNMQAFTLEYLSAGVSYSFQNMSACLYADMQEHNKDALLDAGGKLKNGTFAPGTYHIGVMLSPGTYQLIPIDYGNYVYYAIHGEDYAADPSRSESLESDLWETKEARAIVVEEGQYLYVSGAYLKPIKTSAA